MGQRAGNKSLNYLMAHKTWGFGRRSPHYSRDVTRRTWLARITITRGHLMARQKPIYPSNWKEFSQYIRLERAQGRCECSGQCGLHKTHPGPRRCLEQDRTPAVFAQGLVVLTVAHLCTCDPLCAESTHVLAMCQRCHLRMDAPLHRQHRAETRRREKEVLGQCTFLPQL